MATLFRVLQRVLVQHHRNHVLARSLHRFLDRDRHFPGLAVTEADLALAVADDRQRGKAELPAALDHFRDAVDGHQFFDQVVA